MFTRAVLVTSFALVANESVFRVCSTWLKAGLMVHIIAVRAFPPSEGCNIRVSFESLYGMWPFLFPPLQTERLGKEKKPYAFTVSQIQYCRLCLKFELQKLCRRLKQDAPKMASLLGYFLTFDFLSVFWESKRRLKSHCSTYTINFQMYKVGDKLIRLMRTGYSS